MASSFRMLEQKAHLKTLKEKGVERLLAKAMMLVDMFEAEELSDYLAKAYHFAAVLHEKKGELIKAKEWAMKELEIHQLAELDSSEALTVIEYIDDLNIAEMMSLLPPKESL